jgi:hypothetical protein
MARRWSVPFLSASVALLAIAILAGGLAPVSGAIPNQGTYSACLTKSSGQIEVINYPKIKCGKGERLIRWSQQGPQGPQGAGGPQGPAGPADWNAIPNIPAGFADGVDNEGVTSVRLTRVLGPVTTIPAGVGQFGSSMATCPAGQRATGGGFFSTPLNIFDLSQSTPVGNLTGWFADGTNSSAADTINLTAYAVCASVEPAGAFTIAKRGFLPAAVRKAMKKRGR